MTHNQKRIIETWEVIEEDEPDVSTEQLFARVAAICKCDDGDVAEALALRQGKEE